MIGRLTGVVEAAGGDAAIVDVGGVGYLVHCSAKTLSLAETGAPARLEVETMMREDAIVLFAFAVPGEKAWFKLLTSVQGVGGRLALQILSALSLEELAAAIMAEDRKAIARSDGVGPKLAQRIISVLKDRVAAGDTPTPGFQPAVVASGGGGSAATAEAISALANLGYGKAEAFAAVAKAEAALGPDADLSALITAALKEAAAA